MTRPHAIHAGRTVAASLATAAAMLGQPGLAADPGVSSHEIVIGQSITLQDGKNAYGVAARRGMQVYIEQTNAAGGVHGRQLVVKTLDDRSQVATAEANARQLVDSGVFLLFGSIEGGPSSAVMKVAAEQGVPFIGPMAGSPSLRRPHQPMVYPVRAEHREEFRALMTWGRDTGLRTVGFFHTDSPTGQEHLTNVGLIAKEIDMQVVLPLAYRPEAGDAEIAAMARRIVEVKPDMMINHGGPTLYQKLIAAARQAGAKTTFMAVNSGSSQIAQQLGPLAQGMVFSQVVPSPWERKYAITREYQDAMRRAEPNGEFSYGSLEGYLTAKAMVTALRGVGHDLSRASLRRWLESASIDLGGVRVRYSPGDHAGSRFVDLSMVGRDGHFLH